MHRSNLALGASLLLLLAIASCSTEGPTQGTPLAETSAARTGAPGLPAGVSGAAPAATFGAPSAQEADEEFNCTNVQHVQARFSSPGFVNDNVVGLFVEFMGFPDVNRRLRVWWDEENAPELYQDVSLEDTEIHRVGDLIAFDKIVEHTYVGLTEPKEFRVRVELFLGDLTGNCARVRRVTVGPAALGKGGKQQGLSIVVEGHSNVVVPCAVGDYSCQAQHVCNAVTGLTCVHQTYDCAYGNRGSWYPPDGASGGSNFNFAYDYDFVFGDYGNICACNLSQMSTYGLAATHTYCGVGHWVRQ
jgi:hypothetical protein